MTGTTVIELAVRHLEHVFSPIGLPLPLKGKEQVGTTSILVRGGPGSGKTTLALALAHAVAKHGDGVVLYLTTEFSPVEMMFKATLIGLDESIVQVWPPTPQAVAGGIVVQHLNEMADGSLPLSSGERRQASIDAVWELLHPADATAVESTRAVRAIVIDALTLPGPSEDGGEYRADLVAFVQALESEGRTVVLIEEFVPSTTAWSAFVVDLVLELAFVPDSQSGELQRKLTVSKCRHAISLPGPHDYGLHAGRPAVWPNLFRVVSAMRGNSSQQLARVQQADFAVPLSLRSDSWQSIGASVIISRYDVIATKAMNVLSRTPGVVRVFVSCGAWTTVASDANRRLFSSETVSDSEGVHAIGWAIVRLMATHGINCCIFQNADVFFGRAGGERAVSHLLEALRSLGCLVCIHATTAAAASLSPIATFDWAGAKAIPRSIRRRRRRALGLGALPPQPSALTLSAAASEAWGHFYAGNDWQAGRAALAAVEAEDEPDGPMLLLWKGVCAAVSRSTAAIDDLFSILGGEEEHIALDALLRGLACTNRIDEADRVIDDIAGRATYPLWHTERLRAEARLASDNHDVVRESARRLVALTADASMPDRARADVWFNLGAANDFLSEPQEAVKSFQQARLLAPDLSAAEEEITRLTAILGAGRQDGSDSGGPSS